jgi:hypothetical protein
MNFHNVLLLIELLLMIAAPIAHIIHCIIRLKGRTKRSLITLTLIWFTAGLIMPVLSTYLSIAALPPDVKCATGLGSIMVIGILLTISMIPISTMVFYLVDRYKRIHQQPRN